jgi:hypothetical protein
MWRGLQRLFTLGSEYFVACPSQLRRAANGGIKMNTQATKLQTAENDLKQLMADVTRAMQKAEEAVARIANAAAEDRLKDSKG